MGTTLLNTEMSDYKKLFSQAASYIYYKGSHPLEELLTKQYRESCFLIRKADFFPESNAIVSIFKDGESLEEHISHYYATEPTAVLNPRNVFSFGSVKLLMMDEDEKVSGKWRTIVADAFKTGWLFSRFSKEDISEVHGYEMGGKFALEEHLRKLLIEKKD